jgi:hypothetical protein
MSTIIAGRFEDIRQVRAVLDALPHAGFGSAEYASYYVGPPGTHQLFSIGGDAYSDEGTRESGRGAVLGAVVAGAAGSLLGGIAGAAADTPIGIPVGAVVGAGIGAYVGSLLGALGKTRAGHRERATPSEPVERAGGPMIAVCVDRPDTEPRAIEVLERHGAHEIERARGSWRDGEWLDFDPRVPTETVKRKS